MKRPAPVSPRVSPWVSPLAWGCFSVWPSLVGCWLEGISGSHWRFAVTDLGQSKIALCSALGFQGSISLFSVITSLFILVETGWHGNRFYWSRLDREIDSIRSRVRFVWFRFGLSNAAISRRTIPSFRRRRRRFICVRSASFDVAAANSVRSCGPPKEKLGRGPIKLGRIPEKHILGNIFFFQFHRFHFKCNQKANQNGWPPSINPRVWIEFLFLFFFIDPRKCNKNSVKTR